MKNSKYYTSHANMDLRDELQAALSVQPVTKPKVKRTRATKRAARLERVAIAQGGN
jgi:hypothetical protein